MEVQRCGPRPGSLKPSPFAYLSGSGGGAAAPGYPRGAAWNWDLRRADPQETTSAPGPRRAGSVGSVVRETARSMLGSRGGGREPSRGGSVLELHWAGKGGRPRGSRCSHLTAAASERTGRPLLRDLASSACPPAPSGAAGSKDPCSPVTYTRRRPVPARRCGALAAGPCLALGRLKRGWS